MKEATKHVYVDGAKSSAATNQRDAARLNTHKAYAERNELLGLISQLTDTGFSAHLQPMTGKLGGLDERVALCIHTPAGDGKHLTYILDASEATKDPFARLERWTDSHYDRATAAERSARIAALWKQARGGAHRLELLMPDERGRRESYQAVCSCGWASQPSRTSVDAQRAGTDHVVAASGLGGVR